MDWKEIGKEAIDLFSDLLRFDTTNPPGNETPACKFLAQSLKEDGIESTIIESDKNRGNLIARLGDPGQTNGLLLNSHLDVVPAESEQWSRPPFSGDDHDGYIWGRGAVDMKNMAAMSVMVLKLLKREKIKLTRPIIFTGVADEEAGCKQGSEFLVENHPDKVRAAYMLGEVGGFTMQFGKKTFMPVQVAEKGLCWLKMTAKGTPGHGSTPHQDNAVVKLAQATAIIGKKRLPQHITTSAERFFKNLAASQPAPARLILPLLLKPNLSDLVLNYILPKSAPINTFKALLSNTATPTMLSSGVAVNVIPSKAEVHIDGRLLPGQSPEHLISELKKLIGNDFNFEILKHQPPIEQDPDSPLYEIIKKVVNEKLPEAELIPYIIPGFTDAQFFSRLGMTCYGFSPIKFPANASITFSELFHGHNERIPKDGFLWGLQALYEVVRQYGTS